MSMEEQKIEENRNSQKPRVMKYKLADEGCSEFSADDLSRSTTFQPVIPTSRREKSQESLSDPVSDFSAVQQGDNGIGAGRTTSGQSDFRNEELSPIYISRHNTVDGNIDYYALDLPAAELQQRLENLQVKDCQQSIDDAEDASQVLLGDMTVETDDYAHNGRFVNIRRGGHSQEGSFQKRMLSPSSLPAIDESAMLPEESMQASTPKQLPNIRKTRSSAEYEKYHEAQISPPVPRTPHPSPTKSDAKGHKIHKSSSGSPLKIFGTYDTFTNQKLLRRLSQFEGDFEDNEDISSPSVQESTHPEMNEAFVAASSPDKVSQRSHIHHHSSRRVNSFGKGDLDDFQFSEEISYDSNRSNVEDEDKENISLPVLDPSTQTRFKFHLDPSPALEEEEFTQRRTTYTNTTSTTKQTISVRKTVRPGTGSSGTSTAPPTSQLVEDLETPRKRNGNSEGKRLPKSPLKDPTPKRRRTWHKPDIAQAMANEETVELDSLRETHQQMQSVIGRKRKDARHDDDQQAANPKVLAMRQILRPRTPTPSQRSSQHHERVPLAEVNLSSAERVRFVQEEKIAMIQAELDSTNPLKISTALGVSQQMHDNSRKGSVTTQDFLDEAKKIMAGIRGKARPRSGLTSLEESESENDRNRSSAAATQDDELEDSYQESTKEPFSRPPSREGMPVPRIPLKQQDPELLDHLRKYEEMSEMDGVIVSSIKSLAMAKEAANTAKEIGRITQETISRASGRSLNQADTVECEPPNIRISENPELYRKRKHSTSSVLPGDDEHHEADFPSYGSNGSSNQSTSRSIPTGSSRGSDSRRVVIAPQSVSHLIPAQLAGMVFDREQNVWVRRKAVSGAGGEHNFLPSDETEDDPFGDIPDLSVDETQELQRIKEVAARRKEEARVAQINAHGKQEAAQPRDDRFKPANIGSNPEDVFSSEPSKLTRFASSGTVPEFNTRLTSWGDEHAPVSRLSQHLERKQEAHQSLKYAQTETREGVVEEFEREISIHEDRIDQNSPQRRRNVTISFSSPLASVIQPSSYDDDNDFNEDEVAQSDSDDHEENGNGSVIISKRGSKQKAPLTSMRTAFRNASRHISIGGHKFSTRPVSRIDEQDEDSLNRDGDGPRRRSISIVVATPGRSRREASLVLATPRPAHEIGTLSLTPLSDFTMNQADDSFGMEVSYIAGGQRYVPGGNTKRTLSLSIKELVEKLTEVEPYEPFWEHIRQMDLKDKKLTNLHKLDEFCEQLEDLDISNNQISHLNGAPRTLRHLRITHNYLSDLTAWGHLSNLQYIDVSNNQLESLSAFQCLIHLRGLRADNNKIKSLEGIGQLDGLLSLRLRGNMIDSLDLGGSKLQRLTDLDLKDNNIRDARNLQDLRSLSTLNLENNDLCNFPSDESKLLWALKYLKLSGNNLESIDVSRYPNLRLLYLDRNRLGTVTGLLKTKHLDSLSMREQQEGAVIDPSFLSEAFEVRKLFLSGNLLNTFKPLVDFLNLQYLELANCGLETLPVEFGQMVSNIRVLNLNFNALKDIKPLLGIIRLKKLHVAGNRLSRLRKSMNVLAQFPNLTLADLRGNPLTLGFYPPVMERGLIVHDSGGDEESNVPEPFTLVKADMGMDEKYASRLDMDTRMLRRVYEILVLGGCARLRLLDGLRVDKSVLNLRDKVWEALVRADVVNGAVGDTVCEGNQQEKIGEREVVSEPKSPQTPVPEERWQAEDSFA
jgi:Leucine-rich repeat (LRR) protein